MKDFFKTMTGVRGVNSRQLLKLKRWGSRQYTNVSFSFEKVEGIKE